MSKDIKGQQSLYTQTAEDRIARVEKAVVELAEAEREFSVIREAYVAGRAKKIKALGNLKSASGFDGHQVQIDLEAKQRKDRELAISTVDTTESILERKRVEAEYIALRRLRAAGGVMTNMELAPLCNRDEHGMAGVLSKCVHVEKFHDGNINNQRMSWRLKNPNLDVESLYAR